MSAVYRSICYEADSLLLLITKLTEKEIIIKLEIEKLMNDGFVNIAKARYIMGSTCVTKMQLPTENSNPIKPVATVLRKENDKSCIFQINRAAINNNNESPKDPEKNSEDSASISDLEKKESSDSVIKSEATFRKVLKNEPNSLKKSKNAYYVEDELYQSYNDELLDEMSNSSSQESLVSVTDPIRLFGILVPRALKVAQGSFNQVVNLLGECASIQWELREALNNFHHLEKVKQLIEAASKDTKVDILSPKVYWTPSERSTISCYSVVPSGEDEEGEDLSENSQLSIKKSIRSVFFDHDVGEDREATVWGSGGSENENESDT